MKNQTRWTRETAGTLIGMSLLSIAISACGVRQEETIEESTIAAANADTSASTSTTTNGSDTNSAGNSGTAVATFTGELTGFWLNETEPDYLGEYILRITAGDDHFLFDFFNDRSSGGVYTNCYFHYDSEEFVYSGLGLRPRGDVGKVKNYTEVTLGGDNIQSNYHYSENSVANSANETATFSRTFEGLAANDIQICNEL